MKIRAAVFRDETGKPSIEEIELSGPQAGEVLVKIVSAGICHTDHKSAGPGPVPKPVVLGHEGAGIVEAVGAGVKKLAKGDHVVMTFGSCGRCIACNEAEPAYCDDGMKYCFACKRDDGSFYLNSNQGPVHGDFFSQSSFATYAIGNERSVVKIPRDVPLEIMGPLGCGIQTGAGAIINDFKLRPGKTLAVIGTGALGLSAIMAARIAGARTIIAIDRHAHRVELAKELGAHHGIASDGGGFTQKILELVPGGVDYVLDTTGVLAVMRQGIDALAPRGMAGFVTSPWDGSELSLNVRHLLPGRKVRGIIEGNSNPDVFIPQMISWWKDGRFPFDKLIKFYKFEAIEKAFHDSESGETVKPVLRVA